MTDLDLTLSPDELTQLRSGATLHLHPYLTPPPVPPATARHYPHARFAQLFYFGTPLDATGRRLLNESIDLVACGETSMLASLAAVAPASLPIVLYTNVSNIYQEMLADWTRYATAKGVHFEAAFLHDVPSYTRLGYNGNPARPLTNPANPDFAAWAVDYHARFLAANPRANGLFVDNSVGAPPATSIIPVEDVSGYAAAYAAILGRLKNLGLCVPNTGGADVGPLDLMIAACGWWYEEFMLRPLAHNWKQFEDTAVIVAGRLAFPGGKAILDSHPAGGSPVDPRTQLATLAYYYLLADPERTYLDFFGGFEPGSGWSRHWCAAAAVDVGTPTSNWTPAQSGPDPANIAATYRVYRRAYTKTTVLYRPLSFVNWQTPADLGDASAVLVPASGRPLAADGTAGAAVTGVMLRNGEGAILIQ